MESNPYSLTTATTKEYYRLMFAGLNAGLGLTCLHQIKPPIDTPPPEESETLTMGGENLTMGGEELTW